MPIVGGDENHRSRRVLTQRLQQVEPGEGRHLDIEKKHVGLSFDDSGHGLCGIAEAADDFNGLVLQQFLEELARRGLVVDDDATQSQLRPPLAPPNPASADQSAG